MEQIRFKSVSNEGIRYIVVKDHYDVPDSSYYNSPSSYLGNTCYQYDTYGDNDIQHSPLYLVPGSSLKDFIISLALYVGENHSVDLLPVLENLEPYGISETQVRFLYTLKQSDNGKPTYVNLLECKKTKADKQYDKRWTRLPDDYQPDFKHIYPFFVESFHGFLARVLIAEKLRESTGWNLWIDYETEFKIPQNDIGRIREGLNILQAFLEGYKRIKWIPDALGCLKHNNQIED